MPSSFRYQLRDDPFGSHLYLPWPSEVRVNCPRGEIGRHTGLKILCSVRGVPVRFRPRAPLLDMSRTIHPCTVTIA